MQYMYPTQPAQPTFSEIKSAAKKALKHRWGEAIAVSLIVLGTALLDIIMQALLMTIFKVDAVWSPFTPTSVPFYSIVASNCITVFSAIFSLVIMFPLIFGVMRWFWHVTGGNDPDISDIFYYFSSAKQFGKALLIAIGLFWRMVLGAAICFLPYTAVSLLTQSEFYSRLGVTMPTYMSGAYPLVSLFEALGFFMLLLWISIYAMFYSAMFSEPELSAPRTIKLGSVISRGYRMRFIGFILSFFGWIVLSILALPLLFFVPFFMASLSIYGREIYRSASRTSDTAVRDSAL